MKKSVICLALLSITTSVFASEFKDDDWNLSQKTITRVEAASVNCSTNLENRGLGIQKTSIKMTRPNATNDQILMTAKFDALLDRSDLKKNVALKNSGISDSLFSRGEVYISSAVRTVVHLATDSGITPLGTQTSNDLTFEINDINSGVSVTIPAGAEIVRLSDNSISVSSEAANVGTIKPFRNIDNWGMSSHKSSCQVHLKFYKFAAKKENLATKDKDIESGYHVSYKTESTAGTIPVR